MSHVTGTCDLNCAECDWRIENAHNAHLEQVCGGYARCDICKDEHDCDKTSEPLCPSCPTLSVLPSLSSERAEVNQHHPARSAPPSCEGCSHRSHAAYDCQTIPFLSRRDDRCHCPLQGGLWPA